jgi:hypothetical protein
VQTATLSRLDVQRIYHTVSATFGFDVTVAASAGTHTVCLAAIDQDGQAPVQVRCASVTVS